MDDNEKKPVLQTGDIGSLLDLTTEFLERKKAVKAKTYSEKFVNPTRSNILTVTKEEKKVKEQTSKDRQAKIQQSAEAVRREEAEQLKRQQILEQKAQVYDRMLSGESLTHDDGTEVEFLVNFQRKKKELEERGDEIRKPESGAAFEAAASVFIRRREEDTPLIVHYDPSEEPGRMFGASHIPLPVNDEEARQKMIDDLKRMTDETTRKRNKQKKKLDAKSLADLERLNRLRAIKGLPPLECQSSSSESEEDEGDLNEGPILDVDSIPLPSDMPGPSTAPTDPRPTDAEENPKRFKPVRDWDRGKEFGYKRWIDGQREVRNEEFAPPTSYYTDAKKSKRK